MNRPLNSVEDLEEAKGSFLSNLVGMFFGLLAWSAICIFILLRKAALVWGMAGESWLNVVFIYLALLIGGPILMLCFGWTDRIKSEWARFGVQILICLLIAVLLCLLLAFATM